MAIDETRLNEFLGKAVGDLGAAISATMMLVGDRLGLYKVLAAGPLTPTGLARQTGTNERYVREWLDNQSAGGYVEFDPNEGTYWLSAEQALCLADPNGPVDIAGAFGLVEASFHALDRTLENFRTGVGLEWGEHHAALFHGTERFFRAGYNANLVSSWLPALEGVIPRLLHGARVADVGCGHGASTVLLALTYPNSEFVGYDFRADWIRVACERAAAAGAKNACFEVAGAAEYTGSGFDLIAFFECLEDMGDPIAVARHARAALKDDGTCVLVEPCSTDGDNVQESLDLVGGAMHGPAASMRVPATLARSHSALGLHAAEARLREVMLTAGFSRFRLATETPFNLVFEARP